MTGVTRWGAGRGVAAVAVLLALAGAAPAHAHDPLERRQRQVDHRIDQQEEDLEKSSEAVRRAAAALSSVAVELPAAQARLASVTGRLAAARARQTATLTDLGRAQLALASARRAVDAAGQELRRNRQAVEDMARAAYIHGTPGYAEMILGASSPRALVDGANFVRHALHAQNAVIREAGDARAALASQRAMLAARERELAAHERAAAAAVDRVEELVGAAAHARARIAQAVATRRSALAVAERERAADLRAYRALQAESRRIASLIRAAARRGGGRGTTTQQLLWPAQGPLTSRYGWRTHPVYGDRRFHAGIDIGAKQGRPVWAAASGTVVFVGTLRGYGNFIAIEHAGRLSTAYAHLSRFAARQGQRVRRGQVVGAIGDTGTATAPHLHFETRIDGEPVDPMRYY